MLRHRIKLRANRTIRYGMLNFLQVLSMHLNAGAV